MRKLQDNMGKHWRIPLSMKVYSWENGYQWWIFNPRLMTPEGNQEEDWLKPPRLACNGPSMGAPQWASSCMWTTSKYVENTSILNMCIPHWSTTVSMISRILVGYSWWILTYTHARYMFFHGLPSHRCVQNVELANWRTLGVVWGCLQTWLAGKSPTCFVDFPMKNTFFKPPCIAGAISPARKDSVAQRGESSGCSVLSPK